MESDFASFSSSPSKSRSAASRVVSAGEEVRSKTQRSEKVSNGTTGNRGGEEFSLEEGLSDIKEVDSEETEEVASSAPAARNYPEFPIAFERVLETEYVSDSSPPERNSVSADDQIDAALAAVPVAESKGGPTESNPSRPVQGGEVLRTDSTGIGASFAMPGSKERGGASTERSASRTELQASNVLKAPEASAPPTENLTTQPTEIAEGGQSRSVDRSTIVPPTPIVAADASDESERGLGIDAETADVDIDLGRIAPSAEPARTTAPRPDHLRIETARTVSAQLVASVEQSGDGTIDVTLTPEELGRVRLRLSSNDSVLHVTIQAERHDTQDLMRRHIATLQNDFRQLGYTDVSFDFGRSAQDQKPQTREPDPIADVAVFEDPVQNIGGRTELRLVSTGLDLRL